MRFVTFVFFPFLACTFLTHSLTGQTLTFDGVPLPVDTGAQNGGGDWNTTLLNWYDLGENKNVAWVNDGTYNAAFGNTNSPTGGTINLTQDIFVNDMRFNSLSAGPLLTTGMTHTFSSTNGSTLNFSDGATITAAELSSSGSGTILFINFNLTVKGNNLTMARDPGATGASFQYLRLANDNDLTGTLTLEAPTAAKGIFLLTAGNNTLEGLDKVLVQAGSVLATSGTNQTYTTDIHLAGNGIGNGAIRVDSAGITYAGEIVLTADAGIMTNTSGSNAIITGGITETGGSFGFARFASALDTVLTITGTNTYTGRTTFGRSGSVAGGITILDFSAATAPQDDILYHGVTAGMLEMIGGSYGRAALVLQGKAGVTNNQRFSSLSATGTRSTITLQSGAGGAMNLVLGGISRASTSATLALVLPASGSITTTQADGLIGPWVTLADAAGQGGWAQASGGVVSVFQGTTSHTTGSTLATYASNADLKLDDGSYGVVTTGGTVAQINSLTHADQGSKRLVDIGTGNLLRLGQLSGIQMTGGTTDLWIGRQGTGGSLTAGTTSGASLYLTNMSPSAQMFIHSQIVDNGAGAVNLYINGNGNVILTGANTFTGTVQVSSGSLEVRHATALGTTSGSTQVLAGASLRLSGGITLGEALSLAGTGTTTEGALRNVSGDNTLTGLITMSGPGRINSDAGTLTLQGASASTNVLTVSSSANTVTLGGAGTIVVNGRLNATASAALVKDGTGTVVLNSDNAFTGTTSVTNGILRLGHNNALGTTAGATTISSTGGVELHGTGLSVAEAFTLGSTGMAQSGGLRNTGGSNTFAGLITVNGTSRIQSVEGTLTLDAASGSNAIIKDNSSSNRALTFGGAGDIVVVDAIARQNSGLFSIAKDGSGKLTLKAINTYDGSTSLTGGELHLDFTGVATPTNLLYNGVTTPGALSMAGSTLRLTAKSGTVTSQSFGNLAIGVGQSQFVVEQNGATAVQVTFGNLARAASGSVFEFTPLTAGSYSTTGGVNEALITHDGTASVTWGKNDWAATTAAVDGRRQIVGLSSIMDGYTASTATSLAGNADVVAGAGIVSLSASTDLGSLRFNASQLNYIDLADDVTVTTGGILVGQGVGAFDTYITGGVLRSNSTGTSFTTSDLVIIQNNTQGTLYITSMIDNNLGGATASTSLTKSGAGTVVLDTASHNYSGTTKVVEGVLHLRTGTINTAGQYTLGGGATSGKFKLGNNSTALTIYSDWLQIDGYGTENALVGGGTVLSTFLLDGSNITSDFRRGTIGGTGQYENNISIRMAADNAPLQLGASNTFAGKTTISFGIIEVEKLADLGEASSLGTGNFSGSSLTADAAIIDLSNRTTGAVNQSAYSVLRYTGSTNSTTNRIVRISNTDNSTDISSVIAVLENVGTGTVQFTSAFQAGGGNPVERLLRLSGTNTGMNSMVSINDTSGSILTRIEKTGTGTWAMTGASTHSGGTDILAGTFLAMNTGGTPGSATGAGHVTVAAGATLGGLGTVAPASGKNITVSGAVSAGDSTLTTPQAGALTLTTTGAGALTFKSGSSVVFDLFHGQGLGDNTSDTTAADLLVINGSLVIETGASLILTNPNDMIEWAVDDTWRLFDWTNTGTVTGEFSVLSLPTLGGDLSWDTSKLYSDGVVSITNVPEPGRALLLAMAVAAGVLRRRRAETAG